VFAYSWSFILFISYTFPFLLLHFSFYIILFQKTFSICSFIAGAMSMFSGSPIYPYCCLILWFLFFVQPATSDYIVRDTGNCSPRYMKCTVNQVMFNIFKIILAMNKVMRKAKVSCPCHLCRVLFVASMLWLLKGCFCVLVTYTEGLKGFILLIYFLCFGFQRGFLFLSFLLKKTPYSLALYFFLSKD